MLTYEDGELCKISDCSCLNLSAAHFQIIVFITCRRTEVMYVIIWVKKMTFINWLHKHLKELHRVSKKLCKIVFVSCQMSTNFDNFFTERWQKG